MINYIENGWKNNCGFILTFRNGSFFESLKTKGYTHIAEHLMFSGTKNIPKSELDKIFITTLHDLEAITTRESLSIFCYFDLKGFDVALKTIHSIIYNWECETRQFQNEKIQLVDEAKEYFSSFDYKKRSYVYPHLPMRQNEPLGTLKSLKALKFDDIKSVKKYWHEYIDASDTNLIFLSGGITIKLKKIVNSTFVSKGFDRKEMKQLVIKDKNGFFAKRTSGYFFKSDCYNPKTLLLNAMYESRWRQDDKYEFDYDFIQTDGVTSFYVYHSSQNLRLEPVKDFFYKPFTKDEFSFAKEIFLKLFRERMDTVDIVDSLRWFAGFQNRDYAEIGKIKNNPQKLYLYYKKITFKQMNAFILSIARR